MIEDLAPFLMIVAIFALITIIIINLMKYRLKNKIVNSGIVEQSIIKSILQPGGSKADARGALKWGLLTLFGGTGLIITEFLPFDPYTSALPYGIQLVFLSAGLLVYYQIVKNQSSDKNQE